MKKLVTIIGAMLLLAGVAAAGTFASLGSGSNSNPTISTEPFLATTARHDDLRREDRLQDRATEARGRENELRGRENEPGEDVRGREAEPKDDHRGVTTASHEDRRGADENSGPGSSSSGRGASDDSGSGHGGHGDDD